MADWGLLGGLAEGLKSGMQGYQAERGYQDQKRKEAEDKALKERMAKQAEMQGKAELYGKGLLQSPEGEMSFTPQEIEKQALEKRFKESQIEENLSKAKNKGLVDPTVSAIRDLQLQKAKDEAKSREEAKTSAKGPQSQAATYADRLKQSEAVFNELASKGYNRTDKGEALKANLGSLPLVGGLLQTFEGEDTKRQKQAERNFLNAVLRRESGAAISPSEFSSGESQYFARGGDTPAVLAQKAENRKTALAGLLTESGGASDILEQKKAGLPQTAIAQSKPSLLESSAVAAPAIKSMTREQKIKLLQGQ